MDRSMGLYDSETGETILADVIQDIASLDEPIELLYARAKRGRIVQVRYGCRRIHYFYDEPESQKMITEDEGRNGVSLADILANAPASAPPPDPRLVITVRPNDPTRYEPRLVLSEPAQPLPMPPYCDANGMKVIAELRLALELIANFNSPDPNATVAEERDALIAIARNALGHKS